MVKNPKVRLVNMSEWGIANPHIESEDVEIERPTIIVAGRPSGTVKVALFQYCDPVLAASNNLVIMPLQLLPAGASVGDEFHVFVERAEPDFPEDEHDKANHV